MIECIDITKKYVNGDTETVALGGVSFRIDAGEFVAIIGPSGSGKSTLMHILGALDIPTSGQFLLDGQDVSDFGDDELAELRNRKIGFVFQAFNLLPRANVIRNVCLPLLYAKVPTTEREELAKQALLRTGLEEDSFYKRSNQLSGGQQQRVAIARALVTNPAIILADEPTGNLDSKTEKIVMQTFQQLHSEGRTIVLITHEAEIAAYAQRVITIRDGSIVADRLNGNSGAQTEVIPGGGFAPPAAGTVGA
ncbi:MAG: ABC transporter ATP-binding protein [Thermoleophilia bacterium]